jgi:Uma2 family endonuclease
MATIAPDFPITRLSAQAYFESYPESNLLIELLDGEVIQMASPNDDHQYVRTYLTGLLFAEIALKKRGELRHAPTDVQLDEQNVVQPDLFFVAADNPHCQRIGNKRWVGPPDLCIEILSATTAKHDKGRKFDLYAQAGVKEYWIVSVEHRSIEVYVRQGHDLARYDVYGLEDQMQSPLLAELIFAVVEIFPPQEDKE